MLFSYLIFLSAIFFLLRWYFLLNYHLHSTHAFGSLIRPAFSSFMLHNYKICIYGLNPHCSSLHSHNLENSITRPKWKLVWRLITNLYASWDSFTCIYDCTMQCNANYEQKLTNLKPIDEKWYIRSWSKSRLHYIDHFLPQMSTMSSAFI